MTALNTGDRQRLLRKLAESEGYATPDDLIAETITDSGSPGICSNPDCETTIEEVEPDQDRGWCDACGRNSVVSALILAELI